MKADQEAVWEGLKAEFEQMNAAPFAYTGLTYQQAGLEDIYTEEAATEEESPKEDDFANQEELPGSPEKDGKE
ncbi:MAG: hypothetical protein K6T85_09880 [Gorillibacterium sp.]|nr:hypothetical protein [Gorillibacterium sp.]